MTPLPSRALCAALAIASLGLLPWAAVQAQTQYTCRDNDGNRYVMSRPCPPGLTTTGAAIAPLPDTSRRDEPQVRPPLDVPEHHRYMSGRCRAVDESLRTASQRNTPPDVVAQLRREYQQDCREEESQALSRISRERREAAQQQRESARQEQQAQQLTREQEARRAEQCAESRRILATKKARTDLTPGEQADLRRFEDNVAARCKL